MPKKRRFALLKTTAASAAAAAIAAFVASGPAQAEMRIVDGQAYWSGDPGPVSPGAFWNGGQDKHDPDHYLSWYGEDPQDYKETVHAPHRGDSRCVWRRRVVVTNWDFHHPYIQVCN